MGASESIEVRLSAPIVLIDGVPWWLDEAPRAEPYPGVSIDLKTFYDAQRLNDSCGLSVETWCYKKDKDLLNDSKIVNILGNDHRMRYVPATGALNVLGFDTKTREQAVRLRIDADKTVATRVLHRKPLGQIYDVVHPMKPVTPGAASASHGDAVYLRCAQPRSEDAKP